MKDNRLVKEMVFGTMGGESRRGRPCREWLDDIKEWGGEEIHILNRKAQAHGTWRTVVRTAEPTEQWMNGWIFVCSTFFSPRAIKLKISGGSRSPFKGRDDLYISHFQWQLPATPTNNRLKVASRKQQL